MGALIQQSGTQWEYDEKLEEMNMNKWVSVKERLPELNQWVWIRIAGHRFKAYRAAGGGCWYIEGYDPEKFRDYDVTHWMPIIEGGG